MHDMEHFNLWRVFLNNFAHFNPEEIFSNVAQIVTVEKITCSVCSTATSAPKQCHVWAHKVTSQYFKAENSDPSFTETVFKAFQNEKQAH